MVDDLANEKYWTARYKNEQTGWDIGYPSTPIKTYVDHLENRDLKILIPGAGNAYEAQYLHEQGFMNVNVIDISGAPLEAFRNRCPSFPKEQLHHGDFFNHQGAYDLIIEQTFFCSFPPTEHNRTRYAEKMATLLAPQGLLVGLWFDIPLIVDTDKRPYGGTKEEYLSYFNEQFIVHTFERCYNSIPPRQGNELFGIFEVRK